VVVKEIEFSSVCAHHLLPFYGSAHVAYIPNKLAVGLSKIPRLVDYWASRPQLQERLTDQIAHDLKRRLEAHGVAVVIEARHTCMACRGVRKHNGAMVTSSMLGVFLTASEARQEFLSLISREGV
jgi:GTP cyclohydrolase I